MKASLRRNSRNKRLFRIAVLVVILLVAFYLVPRTLSFVASIVMSPVISVQHWLNQSTDTIPSYFRDRNALLEQLKERDQIISFQSGSDLTVSRLLKENERLRELLGATSTSRIAAGVIGRPTVLPYDVLVLDQGSADGVQIHTPVFIGRDQVIGYVSEVFGGTSVVSLVSSPGLESTVYIIGPNIYTTAVGQGGGVLEVGVPQGVPLAPGDLVVIPSFDAGVYGQIVSIDSVETRPEQYGYVTIDVPLQSLRWVSVGTEQIDESDFETARERVRVVTENLTKIVVPDGVLVEIPTEATSTEATSTPSDNETDS